MLLERPGDQGADHVVSQHHDLRTENQAQAPQQEHDSQHQDVIERRRTAAPALPFRPDAPPVPTRPRSCVRMKGRSTPDHVPILLAGVLQGQKRKGIVGLHGGSRNGRGEGHQWGEDRFPTEPPSGCCGKRSSRNPLAPSRRCQRSVRIGISRSLTPVRARCIRDDCRATGSVAGHFPPPCAPGRTRSRQ